MLTAGVFALRSTCPLGNSAVISKEGRIVAIGYNGAPTGQPHCTDEGCDLDELGHCKRTVHDVFNAIAMAAKYGISTNGADLHCTTAPCPNCCKLIINAGIKRVVYGNPTSKGCHTDYGDEGLNLLKAAGVELIQFDKGEIISGLQ